ncbi:hypothetical protein [Leucothrix mucor]|uniref:hypothetical protein n=1 Tax=Leucothrix mucor TaxID=45248 RepID=UPI0003B69CE5|nr:hypothetical protein [Leucothrix mucor]
MAPEESKQTEQPEQAKSPLAKIIQKVAYLVGILIILLIVWSIIYSLWAIFRDLT